MTRQAKWPDGTPKSTGNAFTSWMANPPAAPSFGAKRGPKPRTGRPEKTAAEMRMLATRVNKHDPITQRGSSFDQVQKLKRAAI